MSYLDDIDTAIQGLADASQALKRAVNGAPVQVRRSATGEVLAGDAGPAVFLSEIRDIVDQGEARLRAFRDQATTPPSAA